MKVFYSLLLTVVCPLLTFAQSNYKQGYVVLSSGDTVRGFINSREWSNTPKSIDFKKNTADNKATVYRPSELKSFSVADANKFITYAGKLSMDVTEVDNAPQGLDTTLRQDTVFLKVIHAGSKVSLLSNSDAVKQRLFIKEDGQEPTELVFHRYTNADHIVLTATTYKEQLKNLAEKYNVSEKAIQYINRMDFSASDVEKAISYINGNPTPVKNNNAPMSRFFVGAGVAFQNSSFEGDNAILPNHTKANTVSPTISLGYDFFQNPSTQRLVIRGELSASYNAPELNGTIHTTAEAAPVTYAFNQFTITFTPQILYNIYNSDALKFYVDLGAGLNFSSYSNNKYTEGGNFPFEQKNYYSLASFWFNIPIKAGVLLNKRIEVFATYIPRADYTDYSGFSLGTSTFGLGVHYCFDKSKTK